MATLFDYLTEKPVASASLGQVYRGRLKAAYGGGEVAVKVQRPHVLEAASLDIHILRRMCKLFSQLPNVRDCPVRVDAVHRRASRLGHAGHARRQLQDHNTIILHADVASLL